MRRAGRPCPPGTMRGPIHGFKEQRTAYQEYCHNSIPPSWVIGLAARRSRISGADLLTDPPSGAGARHQPAGVAHGTARLAAPRWRWRWRAHVTIHGKWCRVIAEAEREERMTRRMVLAGLAVLAACEAPAPPAPPTPPPVAAPQALQRPTLNEDLFVTQRGSGAGYSGNWVRCANVAMGGTTNPCAPGFSTVPVRPSPL